MAAESAVQLRQPQGLDSTFDKSVLDDVDFRVDTCEAHSQFLEMFDLHAGIVGNEEKRRILKLRLNVGDDVSFFRSHVRKIWELVIGRTLGFEERGRIDADPGTHGGGEGDGFHKRSFGRSRTSLNDRIDDSAAVLH